MSDSNALTLTILGSNAALPASGRHPTSQVLKYRNHLYLIDCGEGTQMQMRRFHIKIQQIKAVFISHMHGDHYFGLMGLLNTMHLLGRKTPLMIVAPAALEEIIRFQLKVGGGMLQYPMQFVHTDAAMHGTEAVPVYGDNVLTVQAFPLKHRIACAGFRFEELPPLRTYLPEAGARFGVPLRAIPAIKAGSDFITPDGAVIANRELTADPAPARSYVYCTDTLPVAQTTAFAAGADLLYHEATFIDSDAERAHQTYHSTTKEAARIALDANVKKLLIGHFSARYDDLSVLEREAREVFANSAIAEEGTEFFI